MDFETRWYETGSGGVALEVRRGADQGPEPDTVGEYQTGGGS